MGIIPVNIENLKPDKEYLVTVRTKDGDINAVSPYTESLRFRTPTDSTIPNAPLNLQLAASFLSVLFKFDISTDNDVFQYEYELYKEAQVELVNSLYQPKSGETPHRTGSVYANVFLVSVDDNSATTSTSSITNPVKYYGRVRSIDTSSNIGDWTSLTASDDTPLIDEQFIGSLSAAKITAGTIGAHTITLAGSTSIIRSSNFDGTPVGDGSYSNATTGWLINGQGKAYFYDATVVGSIDIGGFDSGSFHVNDQGDMWLGAGTFGAAPFRVHRTGQLEIGAGTGSTIGGQLIDTIAEAVIDFNSRNNRNATLPTAPTISSDGTAIDHTLNTDGSADISFEWNYTYSDTNGVANNIDGFIVYLYSSTSSSPYTFGTTTALESTYPLNYDQRAVIFSGVAADKYYTFGVRAYRVVDSDIDSNQILYSAIIKSAGTGENPYQPSSSVNYTGNINGTLASTVVSYANAGNTVATNFNNNNDRNSTTPTAPTIASDGTAIDHVLNTDGSADISFEWSYTVSDVFNAANNIDGFIVFVRSSTSSSSYTFGTTPVDETTYYLPREKRAFVLPAAAADRYYNFGVRAYRMVDTDVASAGILTSAIIQSTGTGENPYRPSSTVAFAGDITGTINGTAATVVTTAVSNFNSNNDRKSTTPASSTSVAFGTAISNTNASIDLPLTWTFTGTGDAYDIDGFIIFLRTTSATNATNITTSDLNTDIQQIYLTAEKRSHTFSGISPNSFYRAAIRAYRVVDTDINSAGVIYGPLVNTTERASVTAVLGGSTGVSIGSGKIFIGTGNYSSSDTAFYVDSTGKFSLKDKLVFDGTSLSVAGDISSATGTFQGNINSGSVTATNMWSYNTASGKIISTWDNTSGQYVQLVGGNQAANAGSVGAGGVITLQSVTGVSGTVSLEPSIRFFTNNYGSGQQTGIGSIRAIEPWETNNRKHVIRISASGISNVQQEIDIVASKTNIIGNMEVGGVLTVNNNATFGNSFVVSLGGININAFGNQIFSNAGMLVLRSNVSWSLLKILASSDGVQVRDGTDSVYYPIRASAFNVSSSQDVKTDLTLARSSLETLLSTDIYEWKYIKEKEDRPDDERITHIFPIAEDLPNHLLSSSLDDEKIVDIRDMVGFLWKGIQEMYEGIKHRLNNIETRLQLLE